MMMKRLLLGCLFATSCPVVVVCSNDNGPLQQNNNNAQVQPSPVLIDATDNNRHRRHRRRRRGLNVQVAVSDEQQEVGIDDQLTHNIKGARQPSHQNLSQLPLLPSEFIPQPSPTLSNTTTTTNDSINNKKKQRNLIIDGQSTPPDRYPYAASLLMNNAHVCGGTLIAPDIILTAGHCSGFFDSVLIGLHNILQKPTPKELYGTYNHLIVEQHILHPKHGNVIMNDFALAKLYGKASFVNPVRINNRRDIPKVNDELIVMGWGVTQEFESSSNSDVLRSVNLTSMSNDDCDNSSGMWNGDIVSYTGYVADNMMCAYSTKNQDACQGDSGGPLLNVGSKPEEDVQLGVVSWGIGCALTDFPGVFSRISEEFDWIRSNVCEHSNYPPGYMGCPGSEEEEMWEEISTNFASDNTRLELKQDVTIAIELDMRPGDTSYVIEIDPKRPDDMTFMVSDEETFTDVMSVKERSERSIDGDLQVEFDTFTSRETVVIRRPKLVPDKTYRFTLLDRESDGLAPVLNEQRQRRFRMCYGVMSGAACINAPLESSAVICSGNGNFNMAKSLTCLVEKQTEAPTPKPSSPPQPFMLSLPVIDQNNPNWGTPQLAVPGPPTTGAPFDMLALPEIDIPSVTLPAKAPTWAPFDLGFGEEELIRPTTAAPTVTPISQPSEVPSVSLIPTKVPTTRSPVVSFETNLPLATGETAHPTKAAPLEFLSGTALDEGSFTLNKVTGSPTQGLIVKEEDAVVLVSDAVDSDNSPYLDDKGATIGLPSSSLSSRRVYVSSVLIVAISTVYLVIMM